MKSWGRLFDKVCPLCSGEIIIFTENDQGLVTKPKGNLFAYLALFSFLPFSISLLDMSNPSFTLFEQELQPFCHMWNIPSAAAAAFTLVVT